jgi:hypothetical protein
MGQSKSAAVVFGVVGMLVVAEPRLAAAEPQVEADKLIRHGVELRRIRDDEAAAREFQKAYDLVHSPRSAGQLGLAEQALGRWEDAERHVGEAVHAEDDPWIVKNRAVLDQALATIQAHLGRIEVIGDPEGAEVWMNGRSVGKMPLPDPVHVSAGEVFIELRVPGRPAARQTLTIVGGQYQRVVIHLAEDSAAADRSASPTAAPTAPQPTAPPAADAASAPDDGRSPARAILKWSAAGLAVAGLTTGVVATILHSQNVSKFDNQGCENHNGVGVNASGMPVAACQSALEDFQSDRNWAIVGYAAAGAFAVTWLILELTDPPPAAAAAAAEQALSRWPTCAPSASGAGIFCVAHF